MGYYNWEMLSLHALAHSITLKVVSYEKAMDSF